MMHKKNWMTIIALLASVGLFSACGGQETKPDEEPVAPTPVEPTQVEETTTMDVAPSSDTYLVVRGDSLWTISGKPDIYNNPYHWPLIYKANRDKIDDADLIYPGQELTIERGSSQADVDAAVNHARTRGAWSIGVVEESDKAYLAQ
ncbi:MAG: LysM peptidoglycan-binding domain-containing protein [Gammaproteobacteria bacterium]|nr:LysM peptidoglycan-binding domain-containing protein [Gammaproteobacteria bacterium]